MSDILAAPLSTLCRVRPAEIKIDLDVLFSSKCIGTYAEQHGTTWHSLAQSRTERIEQAEDYDIVGVSGSISVDGGPKENTYFGFIEVPVDGIHGGIITLSCYYGAHGAEYFVLITKLNPYGCRDAEDNFVLPYVAQVAPEVLSQQHPLGDAGIARQMIINRHYGIS